MDPAIQSRLENEFEGCFVNHCREHDCMLKLDQLPAKPVIVDGSTYQRRHNFPHRLCDSLIFYQRGKMVAAAVELKSGNVDISEATEQLQNGTDLICRVVQEQQPVTFLPLLLSDRGIPNPIDRKAFDLRGKVTFRGQARNIILKNCRDRFRAILQEYSCL